MSEVHRDSSSEKQRQPGRASESRQYELCKMHWCLEVTAARFVSALNYIRERLCSGWGKEEGKEGRKDGG